MILIASTIAPHKLDEGFQLVWLQHFEAMQESTNETLAVFLAAEIDRRGYDVYSSMHERLNQVGAKVWTFGIDKRPDTTEPYEVTSGDRFIRICTGRNLAIEYAMNTGASHILYLDTDTEAPPDCLQKLLEVDRALTFGHVPTYCLNGDRLSELPGDCRLHWSSAGFALVRRDVFRHVRWGWDNDESNTDDPTYARDVELMGKALGQDWRPVTRHDVLGKHHPESIVALENRPVDRMLQ